MTRVTVPNPNSPSLTSPSTSIPLPLPQSKSLAQKNRTMEMASSVRDPTATILLYLLLLVVVTGSVTSEITVGGERKGKGMFILGKFRSVIKTEEGEVKVVSGHRRMDDPSPMHIGFVSMEPNTLLVPQYIDANLVIFVRSGNAKIGQIHKGKMAEQRLRQGDLTVVPAGSAFYLINDCSNQQLQIIASIDSSDVGFSSFQSFFISGGHYPASVLSGFDPSTIISAFNVTGEELAIMMSQNGGPIIRMSPQEHKIESDIDVEDDIMERSTWQRLFDYVFGRHQSCDHHHRHHHGRHKIRVPHAYNLYNREPNFSNRYGSTVAVYEEEYEPLKHAGVGVYFVNLTASSMMAPHVNPTAIEYGIILSGHGSIQVVFPNGTLAMNAEVSEGDVFWVPRYFPFCQVASRGGPMEFLVFTTSARTNRLQFLVGRKSVLRAMRGAALATAFNVSDERLDSVLKAQREEVILPSRPAERGVRVGGEDEEVVMLNRRFMFA